MKNKEIQFLLTLKDQLTAKWKSVTDKIGDGAKNMVRTFEKHWASISAGAFAAWNAIQKAMEFVDLYAKHEQGMQSFRGMVGKLGLDATAEFEKIRKASGGLIDDKSLVESANRAMSLGIPLKDLAGFLEIARAKARDMGTSTKEAFDDLVTALGRQSAPILDNLGIIVKTEAANEAYAKSIGRTVSQLTDAEKKQAFMNAALDAGKEALTRQNLELDTLNEKLQRIQATTENVKILLGEGAYRIGMIFAGVLSGVGAAAMQLARVIIYPFARLEEGLAALGLTTSTRIRDAEADLVEWRDKAVDLIGDTFEAAMNRQAEAAQVAGNTQEETTKKVEKYALTLEDLNNKIAEYKTALNSLVPGSKQYTETLVQIALLQKQINDANQGAELAILKATRTGIDQHQKLSVVMGKSWGDATKKAHGYFESLKVSGVEQVDFVRGLTAEMEEDLTQRMSAIHQVMYSMLSVLQDTFTNIFSGEIEEGIKGFLKGVVLILIDTVQAFVMAAAAAAWAKGVMTFGFSTFADLPMVAAATVGLQLLRAFVSAKFHDGGRVPRPGEGTYMNAPASREFPILVRGGETVRTEEQEAALQRSAGNTFNFHFHGPISTAQAFKEIVERGMRETGITDAAQYFRNSRSNLAIVQ